MEINMEKKEILEKLPGIFCDVTNTNEVSFDSSTKREIIEDWDSVAHIQFIFEIEAQFGIKFNSDEIYKFDSFDILAEKIMELLRK